MGFLPQCKYGCINVWELTPVLSGYWRNSSFGHSCTGFIFQPQALPVGYNMPFHNINRLLGAFKWDTEGSFSYKHQFGSDTWDVTAPVPKDTQWVYVRLQLLWQNCSIYGNEIQRLPSVTFFSRSLLSLHVYIPTAYKCTTQLLLQARNMAFETHEHKGGEQTIINETKLLLFCWQQSERKKGQRETSGKSDEGLSSGTRDENSCLPGILTNALKGDPLLIEEGGSLLCWSFVFLHHQTVKENLWAEL